MDKYDAISDHYCYKDTFVLKNKLNIRDVETLEKAEREITAITIRGSFSDRVGRVGNFSTCRRPQIG